MDGHSYFYRHNVKKPIWNRKFELSCCSINLTIFFQKSGCEYEKLENISQNYETSVLMLEVVFDLVEWFVLRDKHMSTYFSS